MTAGQGGGCQRDQGGGRGDACALAWRIPASSVVAVGVGAIGQQAIRGAGERPEAGRRMRGRRPERRAGALVVRALSRRSCLRQWTSRAVELRVRGQPRHRAGGEANWGVRHRQLVGVPDDQGAAGGAGVWSTRGAGVDGGGAERVGWPLVIANPELLDDYSADGVDAAASRVRRGERDREHVPGGVGAGPGVEELEADARGSLGGGRCAGAETGGCSTSRTRSSCSSHNAPGGRGRAQQRETKMLLETRKIWEGTRGCLGAHVHPRCRAEGHSESVHVVLERGATRAGGGAGGAGLVRGAEGLSNHAAKRFPTPERAGKTRCWSNACVRNAVHAGGGSEDGPEFATIGGRGGRGTCSSAATSSRGGCPTRCRSRRCWCGEVNGESECGGEGVS